MGSPVSRLIDSTPFAEYISRNNDINREKVIQTNLYIGESSINHMFHPTDLKRGLFTSDFIPKGSIIMIDKPLSEMINDPVMDLQPLFDAYTSEQSYETWHMVYNSYHNFDIIAKKINIVELGDSHFLVIDDISPEGELFRYYGIAAWFLIATLSLSTRSNLAGYIKFFETALPRCHPVYQPWIKKYINWIQPHLTKKISIPHTDPSYIKAYDNYYATIYQTENMEQHLLKTIPSDWN